VTGARRARAMEPDLAYVALTLANLQTVDPCLMIGNRRGLSWP
jgi:hypothetical protein